MDTKQRLNPLLNGSADEIAMRILALLPRRMLSEPEQGVIEARQREAHARNADERNSALPDGVYRLLQRAGSTGWRHEVEIDGELVILPDEVSGTLEVHEQHAIELARIEIGRRQGLEAGRVARFRIMWGGPL